MVEAKFGGDHYHGDWKWRKKNANIRILNSNVEIKENKYTFKQANEKHGQTMSVKFLMWIIISHNLRS